MDRVNRYEASRTDEGRYRLLIEAITDYAIYMLDTDGVVTSWNPGAQRFKGYTADEIVGSNFSQFYTPEDRASGLPMRALRTAAVEGRFEHEGWRIRRDGSRFWAHVIIDPIRDPDGALIGFAKITRDLTERQKSEQALRQSEQQFRLLVQSVSDYALYMLDRDGNVSSWNAGAQRIKGYTPSEIIGSHFSKFYTDEDREAGLPAIALASAIREGRWEKEGWRIRKDGSRFWAHVVVDPVRDETGDIIGFAKVTRDVTERQQQQKALEETREALFQAQKMDAIGQLTGGVAHDFNNLLAAVLGSLDIVRRRMPYDPRLTPLLENAIQGAQRGATLTQRMLAFARKQELKPEAVDLATLSQGMMNFMQRTLGPEIRIETRFPEGLPLVQTDPNQLENALLNLAVNARDAMPEGGTIVISGAVERAGAEHPLLQGGDYVRLSVSDCGAGMDEETLARASEPFFTTKGVGKGTGLGLSMVHGLAVQSGGAMDIKSEAGAGTSVSLLLPIACGSLTPTASEPSADQNPTERPLVVLTVDDDNLVLMNTAAMLEDLGHEVIQASSGKEALDILRTRTDIDLVITDQAMPKMTGLQLAKAIEWNYLNLPVIIATGYAEMAGEDTGAIPRLAKPFTQAELAAAVRAACKIEMVGV